MSAKILVMHGNTDGGYHWIEEEVTRIGSAPDCTFVIPGIPAHSVTLLYRKGLYSVVNRCRQAIDVAGEPLLPMATLPINGGQSVAIGSDTLMRLEIEGDPAPSPRPRSVVEANGGNHGEVTDESESGGGRKLRQAALVAGAVLASAYLLFGNTNGNAANDLKTDQGFQYIVERLQSNVAMNDDGPKRICQAFQRARVSELRGDTERAVENYELVKDMVRDDDEDIGPARNLEYAIRRDTGNFVTRRLKHLK